MNKVDVYYNEKNKYYLTTDFPVMVCNDSVVQLSDEMVNILKLVGHTGISLNDLIIRSIEMYPQIDVKKIITRLITVGAITSYKKKYTWPINDFGGSLIGDEEIEAVRGVLKSKVLHRYNEINLNDLQTDKYCQCSLFEKKIALKIGMKYGMALNSCTSALECATKGLGLGENDKIIVPAYTYIGTVSALMHCGAIPMICDIDDSLMLSPKAVETILEKNKDIKAIVVVHLRGMTARMKQLVEISRKNNIPIIEDCAQAFGSMYNGKCVGSFGDVSCFSFHQHKVITCGEGGAVLTNDEKIFHRMRLFSDASRLYANKGYLPGFAGHNYRMSEMEAAIGLIQLKRFSEIEKKLKELYSVFLNNIISNSIFTIQKNDDLNGCIPQAIYLTACDKETAMKISNYLFEQGIDAGLCFINGVISRDIYIYWPYVLERGKNFYGAVQPDEICKSTLDILERTIEITLGIKLTKKDIHNLCNELNNYTKKLDKYK
jgi:8-amino-3,8-dideoxy-alpha-D-manno-octulosonate transaminase